jgi:hypothetical protein
MKWRCPITLALAVVLPLTALAKAAFWRKTEMIKRAEIIAVVTITKVEPAKEKRAGWTYNEAATATVEQVLKGKLNTKVVLHGGEGFICAQVHYQPGRQLVFLRHDQDLLVGENWHLGIRTITGNEVDWFVNDTSLELKKTPLDTVMREIETRLKDRG